MTMRSVVLETQDVRHMGQYLDGRVRSFPGLRIGITIPYLQKDGKQCSSQILLNRDRRNSFAEGER
jgi:hypothetical protein